MECYLRKKIISRPHTLFKCTGCKKYICLDEPQLNVCNCRCHKHNKKKIILLPLTKEIKVHSLNKCGIDYENEREGSVEIVKEDNKNINGNNVECPEYIYKKIDQNAKISKYILDENNKYSEHNKYTENEVVKCIENKNDAAKCIENKNEAEKSIENKKEGSKCIKNKNEAAKSIENETKDAAHNENEECIIIQSNECLYYENPKEENEQNNEGIEKSPYQKLNESDEHNNTCVTNKNKTTHKKELGLQSNATVNDNNKKIIIKSKKILKNCHSPIKLHDCKDGNFYNNYNYDYNKHVYLTNQNGGKRMCVKLQFAPLRKFNPFFGYDKIWLESLRKHVILIDKKF